MTEIAPHLRYRRLTRSGFNRGVAHAAHEPGRFIDTSLLPTTARRWASVSAPALDRNWSLFFRKPDEDPDAQRIFQTSVEQRCPPVVQVETIEARLRELRAAAYEEDIVWSDDSEAGMWAFLRRFGVSARPFLTLRDDGHIRALWDNATGDQVGLRFLDRSRIQYVIFSRMEKGDISRNYGVGEHPLVHALIEVAGLNGLLSG